MKKVYMISVDLTTQYLSFTKRKKGNFTVEKAEKIKRMSQEGDKWKLCPFPADSECHEKHHFWDFLAKHAQLNLIVQTPIEEYSTKRLQRCHETKNGWGVLPDWRELERQWEQYAALTWIFLPERTIIGTITKSWMWSKDQTIVKYYNG